jgi:hypothetical protein
MALEDSCPDLFVRNIPEQAAVFIIDIIEDAGNHRCALDGVFIGWQTLLLDTTLSGKVARPELPALLGSRVTIS